MNLLSKPYGTFLSKRLCGAVPSSPAFTCNPAGVDVGGACAIGVINGQDIDVWHVGTWSKTITNTSNGI